MDREFHTMTFKIPQRFASGLCLFEHLLGLFAVPESTHPEESLANHLTWIFCHFPLFAPRQLTPPPEGKGQEYEESGHIR